MGSFGAVNRTHNHAVEVHLKVIRVVHGFGKTWGGHEVFITNHKLFGLCVSIGSIASLTGTYELPITIT